MWQPRPVWRRVFLATLSLALLAVPRIAVGTWRLHVNWETVIMVSAVTFSITWAGLWLYAWIEELGVERTHRPVYSYVDPRAVERFSLRDHPDDKYG